MQQFVELFNRFVATIEPIAEHLGGPGLGLLSFLDSSFISLPEVADALLVLLTINHPDEWIYFALLTTLGSVAGGYTIYLLARKGGGAFIQRRFGPRFIERSTSTVRQHGLAAVTITSLLPPPAPFKLFLLLAGVAQMPTRTFVIAIATGRGFRFFVEAWLAYRYGDHAMQYIQENLPIASLWAAGMVAITVVAGAIWRRRAMAADA